VSISIALVHHPVLSAQGEVVTSAITSLDVHDIARSARTYGLAAYYLIHPVPAQRALVTQICAHWTTGSSAARIPSRQEALRLCVPLATLDDAVADHAARDGVATSAVELWTTTAYSTRCVSFPDARRRLEEAGTSSSVMLLLGTSWGLADDVRNRATLELEPIMGRRGTAVRGHADAAPDFNHLSVRAACAITLDRLFG
jgi:hypothetical protein